MAQKHKYVRPRGFPLGFVIFLTLVLAVNAIGLSLSELLRRLGPPPLGEAITYSPLVVDRDGKLLRPFTTKDGYWRLPARPTAIALWHVEHSYDCTAFLKDFVAALNKEDNPHF